jgi:hypothetical protein
VLASKPRGAEHREAIRAVVHVFGAASDRLVFAGSCVLALYARPNGHALTATKDVDCIFTGCWTHGLGIIGKLVAPSGPLSPDPEVACRYQLKGTSIVVDVIANDGSNIGGIAHWLSQGAAHSFRYALDDTLQVAAITPPYFLATKLDALHGRGHGDDSKDLEDVVTLAVEVPELVARVQEASLIEPVRALWSRCRAKLRLGNLPDIVAMHLGHDDAAEHDRVEKTLVELFG